MIHSQVNLKSLAVVGVPSCQTTSGREVQGVGDAILRDAAVLHRRDLGQEARLHRPFGVVADERLEHRVELHAGEGDGPAGEQEVEAVGLLVDPNHHRAALLTPILGFHDGLGRYTRAQRRGGQTQPGQTLDQSSPVDSMRL